MSYEKEKAKAQRDTAKYGHYEGKGDGSMKEYSPAKRKKKKKKVLAAKSDKFKKAAMKQAKEEQMDSKIRGALSKHYNKK